SISQHIEDLANQHKLRMVLSLDEAHLLPIQVLDQLHILLNFQRDSKPWLSIILVGLPELRETLKRNVLQSLTGRIPIRVHIPPLDPDQVRQYIRHRMSAAGCRREVFADDGLLLISKAVGIIGGAPKSLKTWMALEMAVSVASGSACLARFAVPSPGPVLLYAAEDSESALRSRLESLARHHGLDLAYLDIRVITADSLQLDRMADQQRLEATLMLHRPVLLVLDPLVRLHAIDENAAGEIAALLGYLRVLQRKTGSAIALVHHAKKAVSAHGGAGYSLRGSSDLYAWVDSFLYLRRHHGQLMLSA